MKRKGVFVRREAAVAVYSRDRLLKENASGKQKKKTAAVAPHCYCCLEGGRRPILTSIPLALYSGNESTHIHTHTLRPPSTLPTTVPSAQLLDIRGDIVLSNLPPSPLPNVWRRRAHNDDV